MGVPSGSFVVEGIKDRLGETPVERGCRSKGSFWAPEFEASSAGGRPQAQMRISISTMRAIRLGGDDISFLRLVTLPPKRNLDGASSMVMDHVRLAYLSALQGAILAPLRMITHPAQSTASAPAHCSW